MQKQKSAHHRRSIHQTPGWSWVVDSQIQVDIRCSSSKSLKTTYSPVHEEFTHFEPLKWVVNHSMIYMSESPFINLQP